MVKPVVPSWVSVASLPTPKLKTALSLKSFTSLPITASNLTDKPPFVCNEPFVVLVASLVLSTIILPSVVNWPVEVIVTPLSPAPPAISKSPLSSTRNTSVPSNCLKTKSSLSTFNCIITSPAVPSISIDNWFVPPSWKLISPVVELKSKLPVESIDIGFAAIVKPVVSSWVNVASLSTPKLKTALSLKSFTSLPIIASNLTDKPPSVCKEPSVVDVASVLSFICILPLNVEFLFNTISSLLFVVTNFIYDSFPCFIFKASPKLLFNLITLFVSEQVSKSIEKSFVATIWLVPTPMLFFASVL